MYHKSELQRKTWFIASVLLLTSLQFYPASTSTTILWQDDFDDNNLDEWAFSSISDTSYFLSHNSALYYVCNDMWETLHRAAFHNSSASVGSWSFDVYGRSVIIWFIFIGRYGWDYEGYVFEKNSILDRIEFNLYRIMNGTWTRIGNEHNERSSEGNYSTWFRVNITRNYDGVFSVYLNQSQIIQGTDNVFMTSDLFLFEAHYNNTALDNVIVSQEIPTTSFDGMIFPIFTGMILIVIILAFFSIRTRRQSQ